MFVLESKTKILYFACSEQDTHFMSAQVTHSNECYCISWGWRGLARGRVTETHSSSLRRLDFSGFGNSTRLPRTGGTHQRLLVRIPSLPRSFGSMIYTFWSERVLNSSIKELRGVPWAQHSNESTPMIAATFNRQKLVFSVLQTPMWRKLSGAEERGRDESER